MKIAIVAHIRYPIAEPYAGGLEMQTHLLARALAENGHSVDLYAHPNSDSYGNLIPVPIEDFTGTRARTENIDPIFEAEFINEHHAYQRVMPSLLKGDYDVIHLNTLHYLPISLATLSRAPVLLSLHTPPFDYLRSAVAAQVQQNALKITTVSNALAHQWQDWIEDFTVVHNGIDTEEWPFQNHSADYIFWHGRICKEKGTHLAIQAAGRAGKPIFLAGPKSDVDYYKEKVEPLLNESAVYLGHLQSPELQSWVGNAHCTVFSSVWEEPYGLVLAESLACGTPVAGFNVGAASEILTPETGCLAEVENVEQLAAAILKTGEISRKKCCERAEDFCDYRRMGRQYEELYRRLFSRSKQIDYER